MNNILYNKLIIFGSSGMLGNYIKRYFETCSELQIICITRNDFDVLKDDSIKLENLLHDHLTNKTVIVNAIGVIPQASKNYKLENDYYIRVNEQFPHELANLAEKYNCQMIHSTTDCVFDGKKGNYVETDIHDETNIYGITKSKGEPNNCTVIRTSIIGEEVNNQRSLVEWIKSCTCKSINGYVNHYWNGITCLQYAKVIEYMINNNIFWKGVRHIFSPRTVSKYELVSMINQTYKLLIDINEFRTSETIDKSIKTIYNENNLFNIPDLNIQINEMREFSSILHNNIIPRIFYVYWDGSKLSYLQYLTIITFKKFNPNWKIVLYTPIIRYTQKTWSTTEQKVSYNGFDYLPKLLELDIDVRKIDFEKIGFKNEIPEVIKSDYLRYWLLGNYGGLWSDMDIIYIKPIDQMFSSTLQVYGDINMIDTVIAFYNNYYSIGLLMSKQDNPYFIELVNNANKYLNLTKYQSIGSELLLKLYKNPSLIKNKYKQLNIITLDKYVYLPYDWNKINEIFLLSLPQNIKDHTIGIHWFNGSKISVMYENMIEENKFPDTGSIYPYIKEYLTK
ncbi:dTDP-6-deoxy-L-lyxo-4-hexulose reductase [Fadolivirus algeromassiliense]|jgi:dTDP-4-dehydrorhamnose reductase|uniref:dTDP-6-deoxy-L-lyxo-4-hexulose reductase n=1 Tax=Fadolivirus FV1/VV64 TaxID=3070911 RepID=A0A7D3V5B6_9VIRU|nr:dTDP-6-deoxy-L-lyxo-4-hexulose reductase [Fadolivirus algeromassiliense]QKF93572.1 dTDP-6-deoxy-L-lyxo-4-hexulose reductase [Fadolivirus FV1/VV64]